jgi:hypothetical protein
MANATWLDRNLGGGIDVGRTSGRLRNFRSFLPKTFKVEFNGFLTVALDCFFSSSRRTTPGHIRINFISSRTFTVTIVN